ncbi:MAG: hypothetical protein NTX40_00290 [Planctomycetota bacterium]|nr:hypothetical protein [Planctomycetota bacterium]
MHQASDGQGAVTPHEASGISSGAQETHVISEIITWIVIVFVFPLVAAIWLPNPWDKLPLYRRYLFLLPTWLAILKLIAEIRGVSLREMVVRLATFAERAACGLAGRLADLTVRFVRWVDSAIPRKRSLATRIIRILIALALLAVVLAVVTLLYNVWVLNLPAPDFDFGECVFMSLPAVGGGEVLQISLAIAHPELYSVQLTSRYWQSDEERLHSRAWSPGHGYALVRLRKRDDHPGEDRDGEIEIRLHWKVPWVSLPDKVVRRDAVRYIIERGEAERMGSHP